MGSGRSHKERDLIEKHAERAAVKAVRGANFTHCLKLNSFEPACVVVDDNGDEITIQGKHISDKRTWEKYLCQLSSPVDLEWLTANAGPIAVDYARWFRSGGHTKRYRSIKNRTSRTWLRNAARLTVLLRIVEHKYDTNSFLDEWAESEMGKTLIAKAFSEETNKALGHALKNSESIEEAVENIHLKFLSLLEDRHFSAYESLPGLPAGAPDPLAMPDDEEDGESDE